MPTYDSTYASSQVPSKICSWRGFNLILTAEEQSLDLLASWSALNVTQEGSQH
jgi:hypothetical protein